jgi:hypothetical protein
MSTQSSLPNGLLAPQETWSRFGIIRFLITQLLAQAQTVTLVKVVSCTNAGGLSPIGTVNVQPCVNQVDSAGNPQPHTTIFNLPYFRLGSAGGNGIILDPVVGDIGLCVFASRDLTKVIETEAPANPGSARQYDYSDGLYVGLMLGAAPTQYIQFNSGGITIVSPAAIVAKGSGTPKPLMTENFYTFWVSEVLPFLQGLGYTGGDPPSNSVTTVFEAQ